VPEMQTNTPHPECIRTPRAAFLMLTENTSTVSSQAYFREVGRSGLTGVGGQQISIECRVAPCAAIAEMIVTKRRPIASPVATPSRRLTNSIPRLSSSSTTCRKFLVLLAIRSKAATSTTENFFLRASAMSRSSPGRRAFFPQTSVASNNYCGQKKLLSLGATATATGSQTTFRSFREPDDHLGHGSAHLGIKFGQ
jgi:hypothetical protein